MNISLDPRPATVIAALAACLVPVGTAHAVVVDTDRPKLTSSGYDFGGSTLVGGSPTSGGRLTFDLGGGKIRPRLTGTLHLDNAEGTCARMRLEYLDKQARSLTDPRYGGTVCPEDDRHRRYTVDLSPYAGTEIDNVRVSVMRKTASGWSTATLAAYGVDTQRDDFTINEGGVEFTNVFAPGSPARMLWRLDGAEVEPYLEGGLWRRNVAGLCARMNLRYLTSAGTFLTARAGGEVCTPDNDTYRAHVSLAPYASSKIGKVTVQLQTRVANGSWLVAGSKTVSIAE